MKMKLLSGLTTLLTAYALTGCAAGVSTSGYGYQAGPVGAQYYYSDAVRGQGVPANVPNVPDYDEGTGFDWRMHGAIVARMRAMSGVARVPMTPGYVGGDTGEAGGMTGADGTTPIHPIQQRVNQAVARHSAALARLCREHPTECPNLLR